MEPHQVSVDDIQGYLTRGATPLPFVYRSFLERLEDMQQIESVCLLPKSIFDLYHLRLTDKLVLRIRKAQGTKRRRKVA